MLKTSFVVHSPNRQKARIAPGLMLSHGSAIRPWPSGKIMAATPRTPEAVGSCLHAHGAVLDAAKVAIRYERPALAPVEVARRPNSRSPSPPTVDRRAA